MGDESKPGAKAPPAVLLRFPTPPDYAARKARADSAERLDRALAGLLRATQEQAAVIGAWRASLAELRDNVGELAGSVTRFQDALADAGGQVDRLGHGLRRLGSSFR